MPRAAPPVEPLSPARSPLATPSRDALLTPPPRKRNKTEKGQHYHDHDAEVEDHIFRQERAQKPLERAETAPPRVGRPEQAPPCGTTRDAPCGTTPSSNADAVKRKKNKRKGCGGTRPEARNKLLEPLNNGTGHLGLACCVAQDEIKYGSLRQITEEKLGDYLSRAKAAYEHLTPNAKQHVDFIQRLEAELKFKKHNRYFFSSKCSCHVTSVSKLLHRVEKKNNHAAPGAAQTVPGRAGGAEMAGGDTKRQKVEPPSAMDEDDADASDSDEEFMAPAVYARSPFRRGEKVLVPANAFGDDYAAENPETLSGTLICIKSVERDEAGEERRIWDVQYETGPFETDESFFDTDETRRVSSDEDDTPADLSDEAAAAAAAAPKKRQRRDTTEREPG